jgi:hypothetical protein
MNKIMRFYLNEMAILIWMELDLSELSNANQANLFIIIHADYSANPYT